MQVIAHHANIVATLQWYGNNNSNNQLFHLMVLSPNTRLWYHWGNTSLKYRRRTQACLGFRFWCKVWLKTSPASFFSFHSCGYIQKIGLGTFLMLIVNHDWSAPLIKMSNGQVSPHIWWDRRSSGIDLICSINHYHIALLTCAAKHIDEPIYKIWIIVHE